MNEINIDCQTRFGKTGATVEAIKDLIAQHGAVYRITIIKLLQKIEK